VVACALVAVATACSSSRNDASKPPTTGAPATTHPARGAKDWVQPGHDYDNTRATFDSTIRLANVSKLKVAWTAKLSGALTTVPLIVGDTIYVQDGSGRVSAIDRVTGKTRWQNPGNGFNIGPFGVAFADGRVFALHGATGVMALDATTGHTIWTKDVTKTKSEGVDIQPTVFDGTVYFATVPISPGGIYTGGDRGTIWALDAETGVPRWHFDTVDSPDLWGNPKVNSGGGAWYAPAIDPSRGVIYWGIANPAPFPGTPEFPNGSSRPGPNLYTDSTVALDLKTGKLRWYHQVTPHDLFDRDLIHALIATTTEGKRVVIGTGKGGVIVGLDEDHGTALWSTPVGDHENDQLTSLTGPTQIAPGTFGGILTPPATADGVVYAAVVNAPITLKPNETSYFGAQFGQRNGLVVAVDAQTGKLQWSTAVPGDPLGGATVVNDVVFTALLGGGIVALNRATGAIVATTKSAGVNGWMAAAGDLLGVPVSSSDPPQLVAYRVS
jgi:glucose dehydrogenase